MLFEERLEFFGCEVGSIVRDYVVRNTKAIYDRLDEIDCCSGSRTRDGTASIHLVNLSTATRRCVWPPLEDFLSGPTISSPYWAKGHANGIVFNVDAGVCGFVANF